jgi:hypothetical protein
VSVEVPELVTDACLNTERVCGGKPATLKATVAMKEPTGLIMTVKDATAPLRTLWLAGDAEIVKSATTSVTCAT